MDDAYCSLSLLQRLSDQCRQRSGTPLLPDDFTDANSAMRVMIGEPAASQLDKYVQQQFNSPTLLGVLGALAGAALVAGVMGAAMRPDPIWGNMSASEIADLRLKSMGIGI